MDRGSSLQLLARVRCEGHMRTAVVESIVCGCDDVAIKRQQESLEVPQNISILEWFEKHVAPRYSNHPIYAQMTEDEHETTLYFDSRFMFDCYTDYSSCGKVGTEADDVDVTEYSQNVALHFFGPRRVPSHFRRRQAVLVRVHGLIKRHWLRYAWDRLAVRSSVSSEVNSRLYQIITRNFVRRKRLRLLRGTYKRWQVNTATLKRKTKVVGNLVIVLEKYILKQTLDKLFRHALGSKISDLVKEYKTPPRKTGVTGMGLLSPEAIMSFIMKNHLDLSDSLVSKVLGGNSPKTPDSPDSDKDSDSVEDSTDGNRAEPKGIRTRTSRRARTNSLSSTSPCSSGSVGTPPCSPYSPFSRLSPLMHIPERNIVALRRAANGVQRSPLAEHLHRQRQQRTGGISGGAISNSGSKIPTKAASKLAGRVLLQSDTPVWTSNNDQGSGDLNTSTTSSASGSGDNALSAWRQQAMMQQKKLRQGVSDNSFNTSLGSTQRGPGSVQDQQYLFTSTPLSAGIVNRWCVVPTPPSATSSTSMFNKREQTGKYIPENPDSAADSTMSTLVTPLTSCSSISASPQEPFTLAENSVVKLLKRLNLSMYITKFVEEELTDLSLLVKMCIEDKKEFKSTLAELGFTKIGHRERLMQALLEENEKSKHETKKKLRLHKKKRKNKHPRKKKDSLDNESEQSTNSILMALHTSKERERKAHYVADLHSSTHVKRIGRVLTKEVIRSVGLEWTPPRRTKASDWIDWEIQQELNKSIRCVRPQYKRSDSLASFRLRCEYYRRLGMTV